MLRFVQYDNLHLFSGPGVDIVVVLLPVLHFQRYKVVDRMHVAGIVGKLNRRGGTQLPERFVEDHGDVHDQVGGGHLDGIIQISSRIDIFQRFDIEFAILRMDGHGELMLFVRIRLLIGRVQLVTVGQVIAVSRRQPDLGLGGGCQPVKFGGAAHAHVHGYFAVGGSHMLHGAFAGLVLLRLAFAVLVVRLSPGVHGGGGIGTYAAKLFGMHAHSAGDCDRFLAAFDLGCGVQENDRNRQASRAAVIAAARPGDRLGDDHVAVIGGLLFEFHTQFSRQIVHQLIGHGHGGLPHAIPEFLFRVLQEAAFGILDQILLVVIDLLTEGRFQLLIQVVRHVFDALLLKEPLQFIFEGLGPLDISLVEDRDPVSHLVDNGIDERIQETVHRAAQGVLQILFDFGRIPSFSGKLVGDHPDGAADDRVAAVLEDLVDDGLPGVARHFGRSGANRVLQED